MQNHRASDNPLKWDDIPVFLAISRAGTLSAAATHLGINTSTVQRRLTGLERSLGTRLFERAPTGLTPTAAGEALRPLAERLEDGVDDLLRAVAGLDAAPAGTVHLTAPETLVGLLVEPLAEFRRRYPAIDLQVSFADRFYDLAAREADVALRPSPRPPEDALGRRIAAVAWAPYVRASAEADDALPWARFTGGLEGLAAARWWAREHGDAPVLLAVNTIAAMHRVVRCSSCRGILPCFVGDADPELRRLDPLLPKASALWLLRHPDLRDTARVRALADHLWTALAKRRALFEGAAQISGAAMVPR